MGKLLMYDWEISELIFDLKLKYDFAIAKVAFIKTYIKIRIDLVNS